MANQLVIYDWLVIIAEWKVYSWAFTRESLLDLTLGGTMSLASMLVLVGGLEHDLYFPSYMGCHPSH